MPKKKKAKKPEKNKRLDMKRELMKAQRLRGAALMLAQHQEANNPKVKPLIRTVEQCGKEVADIKRQIAAVKVRARDAAARLVKALQPYIPKEFRDGPEE